MKDFETLDFEEEKEDTSLRVTNEIKDNFETTANWSIFIAITGFLLAGYILLGAIKFINFIGYSSFQSIRFFLLTFIYILIAFTLIITMIFLIRFAIKMRKSIRQSHQHSFIQASELLKSHYRILGISIIIIVALFVISASRLI